MDTREVPLQVAQAIGMHPSRIRKYHLQAFLRNRNVSPGGKSKKELVKEMQTYLKLQNKIRPIPSWKSEKILDPMQVDLPTKSGRIVVIQTCAPQPTKQDSMKRKRGHNKNMGRASSTNRNPVGKMQNERLRPSPRLNRRNASPTRIPPPPPIPNRSARIPPPPPPPSSRGNGKLPETRAPGSGSNVPTRVESSNEAAARARGGLLNALRNRFRTNSLLRNRMAREIIHE